MINLFKSSIYMFISLFARLLTNVGIFFILAKFWNVQMFGEFMYYFTFTTLIVLFVDYGFSLKLVKDISTSPTDIKYLVSKAFGCKLFLTFILVLVQFLFLNELDNYLLFVVLLSSSIFNSFGLFFCLPFRAINDFKSESVVTSVSNMLLILFILLLMFIDFTALTVSIAFLAGRLLFLCMSISTYKKKIGPLKIRELMKLKRNRQILNELRSNFPYAVHFAAGTIYLQIDTMIMHTYLGDNGVGFYQASVRILMGALLLNDVLTNVVLPKLSANNENFDKIGENINRIFLGIGSLVSIILFVFAEQIINLLYGPNYHLTISLLKLSSILLIIKYMGGLYGVLLTVSNKQNIRVMAVLISITINVALNIVLIPKVGMKGAVVAAIVSSIVLNVIYMFVNINVNKSVFINKRYIVLIIFYCTVICLNYFYHLSLLASIAVTLITIIIILIIGTNNDEKNILFSYIKIKKMSSIKARRGA
ncbi:oligosaccharide flippase family protein [Priestia megaterium]|uniref:oligosaccharide flippase family protein n=1 Tax=Priestia megaterium TaxID=1404 RepID=UPI000BEDC106|nr:oligosaccharide flippase family protein [Priestia megaterium]PED65893.1 hypothetical protein CON20_15715 [Priestia megaterium]